MADFQDNLEVMNQFFGLNNKEKQKKIMFARKDKRMIEMRDQAAAAGVTGRT